MQQLPEWWNSDKPYKIMDCLEGLKDIPDNSVDLVLTDPPYFRIMLRDYANNRYEWDNQWKTFDCYLDWCTCWLKDCYRVLKHNGSIYVFADDKRVSYINILMDKLGFNLENHIIWHKPNSLSNKGWRKYNLYAPVTERILFCSKEHRSRNIENKFYSTTIQAFTPIIEYMKNEKEKVKKYMNFTTDKEFNDYVNKITNTKSVVSHHYFTYSQWVFPTRNLYLKLQSINKDIFKKEYDILKKEYDILKKEYDILKKEYEDLLRYFCPSENYTDVWTFNITSSIEKVFHSTQKPITIFNRIIQTSCKKNGIVLDPFLGSGTTLRACKETDRIGLGFEINPDYEKLIIERSFCKIKSLNYF